MFETQRLVYLRNRINVKNLASHLGIQMKVKDNQCWFVCPKCLELKASFRKNQNLARCWKCNTRYNSIELVMAHFNICERITPRVLRHSFATEMYHQKVPLSAIQAMMGHCSNDETAIYIHVSDQLKKQALEMITITGEPSCRY